MYLKKKKKQVQKSFSQHKTFMWIERHSSYNDIAVRYTVWGDQKSIGLLSYYEK